MFYLPVKVMFDFKDYLQDKYKSHAKSVEFLKQLAHTHTHTHTHTH